MSHIQPQGGSTPVYLNGESGLTLIECLVAIVVLAITASAITPPLVIAVATRVQSQRIEQAIEVAQQEIDRVRLIVEQGDYIDDDLPQSTPTVTNSTISTFSGPAYTANPEPTETVYSDLAPTQVKEFDIDADGSPDYVIQIYRSPGQVVTTSSGERPLSFGLAVRVYDIDAIAAESSGNLDTQPARAGLTGGQGERAAKPLAALYTTIVRGEDDQAYCEYFAYSSTQFDTSRSLPSGCE